MSLIRLQPRSEDRNMVLLLGVILCWLAIGSLIGASLLRDYLRAEARFPEEVDWSLIAAVAIVWPWPVWVWYSSRHAIPETARIGLMAIIFTGSLGLGWVSGLNLYEYVYPKQPETADVPGLNVMIQGVLNSEVTGNISTKSAQTRSGPVSSSITSK
jgi:hypothetical protein